MIITRNNLIGWIAIGMWMGLGIYSNRESMSLFKGSPGLWAGKDVGMAGQDEIGLQLGFVMTPYENRRT